MGEIHAGPIMDKIEGIPRHCETVLHNSRCPYLKFGCLGCTFKAPALLFSEALALMRKRQQDG